MKKFTALLLAAVMLCALAGCRDAGPVIMAPLDSSVTLDVVTAFGGDDGNRVNYEAAVAAYEVASGNHINDASENSSEEWKGRVRQDFESGNEPDVLFYFNGADANAFISAGLVVSLEEIRETYPEYAANMKFEMLTPSSVDGRAYSVPVNSYVEALFVNKRVLGQAGVAMPGPDYTWEQFMEDCQKIRKAGFVPIAASLQEIPHYLFEYVVYNEGTTENHLELPTVATDPVGQKWVNGLNTIKDMYEQGFFPENTLTASETECVQLLADGEAAFLIDGSWRLGFFRDAYGDRLEDFAVTYVPGKGDRAATDMIGGISMGYYITRKAWDNPQKRDAAIRFIEYMTSDSVVSTFATSPASSPLINGVILSENLDSLQLQTITVLENATGFVGAVQDMLTTDARGTLFAGVKDVVTGKATAENVVNACIDIQIR